MWPENRVIPSDAEFDRHFDDSRTEACPHCNGRGWMPTDPGGNEEPIEEWLSYPERDTAICPECGGDGQIVRKPSWYGIDD